MTSSSLGLIDAKPKAQYVVHNVTEQGVDPELDADNVVVVVLNPQLAMSDVYDQWTRDFYVYLQSNYKYVLPVSKRRVTIGAEMKVSQSMLTIRSILYDADPNDPVATKKVFKRYEQKPIGFVRSDDATNTRVVTFRTRNGKSLTDDLLAQMAASGVLVTRLTPEEQELKRAELDAQTKAAALAIQLELEKKDAAARDERLKREAAEKAERDRLQAEADIKQRAEEDAARRPLPFGQPAPYSKQPFPWEQSLYVGDNVSADDFVADLQQDGSSAVADQAAQQQPAQQQQQAGSSDAPLAPPPEPTPEEMSARGKQTFARDEIHEQLWVFYEQVIKHFKPVVVVTVEAEDGSSTQHVIHPTVFCMNDVQYLFENHFTAIDKIKEAMVHVFPLWDLHPDASSPQIYSSQTEEYFWIENPSQFSVIGDLLEKDAVGYILHKCRLSSNTNNKRTERNLSDEVAVFFLQVRDYVAGLRSKREKRSLAPPAAAAAKAANVVVKSQAAAPAPAPVPIAATAPAPPKTAACNCNAQFRTLGQPVRPVMTTNLVRNFNLNQRAMAGPRSDSDSSASSRRSKRRDGSNSTSNDSDEEEQYSRSRRSRTRHDHGSRTLF